MIKIVPKGRSTRQGRGINELTIEANHLIDILSENRVQGTTKTAAVKKSKSATKKLSDKQKKVLKRIRRFMEVDKEVREVEDFMHESGNNIVLLPEPISKYVSVRGRIRKKKMDEFSDVLDKSHVLVDSGLNVLRKIPFHAYRKLKKIEYAILTIDINILEDGDSEYFNAVSNTYRISSLNQLLYVLIRREGLIEGLRAYHRDLGWYNYVNVVEKINILYKSGAVEILKLDKFLARYKLYN